MSCSPVLSTRAARSGRALASGAGPQGMLAAHGFVHPVPMRARNAALARVRWI
ncbi:hypothetical protein [Paraburkholderia ferrariae]|uniref:hypothetical protein n=1 Tax=Paraburkholderia ferrariae TaxID=386056 RepID=UPI000A63C9BB|nr:hypothetical protein [Paraburkholderia ferrariae]